MAFLHFIPDKDDPRGMMRRLTPGSYLALSHAVSDDPEVRRRMTEFILNTTRGNFGRIRKKQEVRAFFAGLEPVEPGLVNTTTWHPDGGEEEQSEQ